MTPYEFSLRTKAVNLRAINEERKLYVNALANRIFTATDDKGEKYIFNDVKDKSSSEELEKLNEITENARRLEQARKIVEERRKKHGTE